MAQKIADNIFKIEVPLKLGLLDHLNAYLIKGDPCLLIDTGIDKPEAVNFLNASLKELGTSLEDCDIFLTHMHYDHSDIACRLALEGKESFIGAYEAEILNGKRLRPDMGAEYIRSLGFPEDFHDEVAKVATIRKTPDEERFIGVREGDTFEYGGFKLYCVDIAGHSPGQTGLYIPDRKIFFCGDHILYGVTPGVKTIGEKENLLNVYLRNLLKLKDYDIETPLPGHYGVTGPVYDRIDQIVGRHYKKIDDTFNTLKENGPMSPYDISAKIAWSKSWDKLDPHQKSTAVGEVAIKLEYLFEQGSVEKNTVDGVSVYSVR